MQIRRVTRSPIPVALAALALAAGCPKEGGGGGEGEADETSESTSADGEGEGQAAGGDEGDDGEAVVNVYSHRHYEADEQLFDAFEDETGIEVKVVKANADELIQRLKTEGERSPGDIFMAADAARLVRAQDAGVLQSVESDVLDERIPEHLRAPDGQWFGLSKRARVIVYDKSRSEPDMLSTYEALAEPDMEGKVLIRRGTNIYNQSLLASLIAHHGEDEAEAWAEGVVENMAREPQGSDRDQMKALAAGEGDVAVVNTYYVGLLLNSDVPAEREVGEKMGVFFPNQDGRGTHVNISGAGVTQHAPHRENAIELLEFLVSDEAQEVFAQANYEFPVVDGVEPSELLASWGDFKEDQLPLIELGENNDLAVKIFDRVGWR